MVAPYGCSNLRGVAWDESGLIPDRFALTNVPLEHADQERKDGHGEGTKLQGVLGGALLEDNTDNIDLTYKIETMGCQMNSADSERIEGQLMSLGIRPLLDDEMKEVLIS